jgi:hypothetical protein
MANTDHINSCYRLNITDCGPSDICADKAGASIRCTAFRILDEQHGHGELFPHVVSEQLNRQCSSERQRYLLHERHLWKTGISPVKHHQHSRAPLPLRWLPIAHDYGITLLTINISIVSFSTISQGPLSNLFQVYLKAYATIRNYC